MDYKEKYNKLVEAIKVLQETNPSDEGIQNWVNDNVPELASEDERIRKEIRDFICWATDRGCITKEQVEKSNSWLAWLEKQGEQKPADARIMWHDVSEKPDEMKEILVEWGSDDATWHTVGFYDAGTDKFREYKMPIDNVVRWMYVDELLEKQKMEE